MIISNTPSEEDKLEAGIRQIEMLIDAGGYIMIDDDPVEGIKAEVKRHLKQRTAERVKAWAVPRGAA